jgi:adenylate kinase
MIIKLILLGAPGAGKGTQAKLIAKRYKIPHVAAGDLLRDAVEKGTYLGKLAHEYMTSGQLVPDHIVIELINKRLAKPDTKQGYILDGFPRSIQQAKKLKKDKNLDIDLVLNIDVKFSFLLERLTGRRSCVNCGAVFHIKYNPPITENICDNCSSMLFQRKDDQEEVIKKRLETYKQETKPLIEFYQQRNKLKNVPGSGTINEIFKSIVTKLDEIN